MRVVLTALALMAFAFLLNLLGDLAGATSVPPQRVAASAHVAIEPPSMREAPRAARLTVRARKPPVVRVAAVARALKPLKVAHAKPPHAVRLVTPASEKYVTLAKAPPAGRKAILLAGTARAA